MFAQVAVRLIAGGWWDRQVWCFQVVVLIIGLTSWLKVQSWAEQMDTKEDGESTTNDLCVPWKADCEAGCGMLIQCGILWVRMQRRRHIACMSTPLNDDAFNPRTLLVFAKEYWTCWGLNLVICVEKSIKRKRQLGSETVWINWRLISFLKLEVLQGIRSASWITLPGRTAHEGWNRKCVIAEKKRRTLIQNSQLWFV